MPATPEFCHVCVIGWYYLAEFYQHLCAFPNVFVTAHRTHELQGKFSGCLRENVGLEWGAYHHYLTHHWDGESSVLFTHDDIRVVCPTVEFVAYVRELVAHPGLMMGPSYSQFFVLKPEALRLIKDDGGFWHDTTNHGNVTRNKWRVNRGVRAFRRQLKRLGIQYERVPCDGILEIGRRGQFAEAPRVTESSLLGP